MFQAEGGLGCSALRLLSLSMSLRMFPEEALAKFRIRVTGNFEMEPRFPVWV